MTYANVNDVADRLGRPITDPTEVRQVTAWLGDLEDRIMVRFTRSALVLADQVALGAPSAATLVRVEADAVVRRILQPVPGRTSTTRSVDDASVTDRWEGQAGTVSGLTDEEWAELLPLASSGAFSTRPAFVADDPTLDPLAFA